ncbi:ATP-binding protein [Adlercreutzia mucosicola]|uniref:ATP-binding protein n=1 Tax=Adlercreutzia mucosicola TaxID=580026 RepID=UPI0003F96826|nr:ATP-binding protein [Adlercreutzia mucosicola]MCR2036152.1 ATP-binding protein [Adlercreutzia mucosicola]
MALNITRGIVPKAQKVVVYGPEGIGKTTLAARFPDPLFVDVEGGSAHMDVARVEAPRSWAALLSAVDAVAAERPCATLVIDTADWAERLCAEHLCAKNRWASIETPGYGKGYTELAEEFGRLLDKLTEAAGAGVNVVLAAHAAMRKFEQPDEAAAYDRWELKLQKKTAPLVKEWADAVLFLTYKTIVEKVGEGFGAKGKARGGKRVMYASHHPCWDAKNRWGLPDESPLGFEAIAPHVSDMRQGVLATENVAKTACQQNPLPSAASAPVTAGPGQTITCGAGGPTVAPAGTGPAAAAAKMPPQWDRVAQLCASDGYSCEEVMAASVMLGNFTADTPAESYPADYLDGFVAANWPAFREHIDNMRADAEPVPFD